MQELKGYLLTDDEANACLELIKILRSKPKQEKTFSINFEGAVSFKATTLEEAMYKFENWKNKIPHNYLEDTGYSVS